MASSHMPLKWSILPTERLIRATAEGVVRLPDIVAYLEAVAAANALPYRKLFDAREGTSELSESDLTDYAGRASAYAAMARLGPCAIAVRRANRAHMPLIERLMLTQRPIRAFYDMDEALEWLRGQPVDD